MTGQSSASPTSPSPSTTSPTTATPTKQDEGGPRSVAAFIAKLYTMVEDEKVQHLIHWNPSGGFVVVNPEDFSREVLPQYFKHNNFASFVRQLNMYGFHKVNDFINAVPSTDSQPSWEFSHPLFQKGKRELLVDIKRKVSVRGNAVKPEVELQQIKEHKDGMNVMGGRVTTVEDRVKQVQENAAILWTELVATKAQVRQQQAVLENLVQYLTSQFADEEVEVRPPKKRKPDMPQPLQMAATMLSNVASGARLATAGSHEIEDDAVLLSSLITMPRGSKGSSDTTRDKKSAQENAGSNQES